MPIVLAIGTCAYRQAKMGQGNEVFMSDKFNVANVFTESEIQIGSLSVDDFHKIRSEARRDLKLHAWQWVNAITVAYRTYFATMKCLVFIFGLLLAEKFIFGGKGFDANAKYLHDVIVNGLSADEVSMLPKFYLGVLDFCGLILTASAQLACVAAILSIFSSYINLFSDEFRKYIVEPIERQLFARLDKLFGTKPSNKNPASYNGHVVLYRCVPPFFCGYKDYFYESIERKIKVLLQEQTDSPIVVKIKNDPVMS